MTIPNNNNHHFVLWYNKEQKKWLPIFVDSAESVLHYPCECENEQATPSDNSSENNSSAPAPAIDVESLISAINDNTDSNAEDISDTVTDSIESLQTAINSLQTAINSNTDSKAADILEGIEDVEDDIESASTALLNAINGNTNSKTTEILTAIDDIDTSSLQTAINNNTNSKATEILAAIDDIDVGGSSGISSAELTQLKNDIVSGVQNIIRPTGHQYPNTNLYPIQMIPRFLIPTTSSGSVTANNLYVNDGSVVQMDLSNADHLYVLEHLDISRFQNISHVFRGIKSSPGITVNLSGWDVSNVKKAQLLFNGMESSQGYTGSNGTFNLSNWDVRNISDMSFMLAGYFSTASSNIVYFDSLILDNWNVTNVSKMDSMFVNIRVPELDLSTWDMSYVSSFRYMFDSYTSSPYVPILEKLLWGGAINAIDTSSSTPALDLSKTILTPSNANLFFQSLATKTSGGTTTIKMPTTAQGADISIATAKGYTIIGITQP